MRVRAVQFESEDFGCESAPARALVVLTTDMGRCALVCTSNLPPDASATDHRLAWLRDAVRQQERMPEMRSTGERLELPDDVLAESGLTKL